MAACACLQRDVKGWGSSEGLVQVWGGLKLGPANWEEDQSQNREQMVAATAIVLSVNFLLR